MTLVGAVLCGGRSARMGAPKEAIRLADGRTMLEHVGDALAAVCDTVVVSGAPATSAPWRAIDDLRAGAGPLGGVEALLASGLGDAYLVCPCDLPRIDAATLDRLRAGGAQPVVVLRVAGEARWRPLPARITGAAAASLTRILDRGERTVARAFEAIGIEARLVDDGDRLHNANRPEDL